MLLIGPSIVCITFEIDGTGRGDDIWGKLGRMVWKRILKV